MAPAVAWLLFLQLVLGPTVVVDTMLQAAIKNFRNIHMDYPQVNYPAGFQGYCNGLVAYVRAKKNNWYCPKNHYVIHAPWEAILKACKTCENFCENYNEYCTLTQDSFPITTCSLVTKKLSTSCHYNGTLTNQRLYLLCSGKRDAKPIGIIDLY
ncbi:probable inactive ribonuclease-like protein 13 [Saccopteryx leptura]|uniref:probable inactive ribonuclease-like protein 13 n=1 Tax=Saccopteryx leptura TaxID=249018 RepID=UPI00339CC009